MKRIATSIRLGLLNTHVNEVLNTREPIVTKLTVQRHGVQIKIEVTPVLLGCVFEPKVRSVKPSVESAFGFAEMVSVRSHPPCLALADGLEGTLLRR